LTLRDRTAAVNVLLSALSNGECQWRRGFRVDGIVSQGDAQKVPKVASH